MKITKFIAFCAILCFPLLFLILRALAADLNKELAKMTPEEREKELWRMR